MQHTDNAAKAKRIRKGFSKAAGAGAGAGSTSGSRANSKTPTSKDRAEDREMSVRVMPKAGNAEPSQNKNGLKENEQTPTSATVRLPYRNGAELRSGSMGSKEVRAIENEGGGAVELDMEDKMTPREGGSVNGDEGYKKDADDDIEQGGQVSSRPPSPVRGASSPYESLLVVDGTQVG